MRLRTGSVLPRLNTCDAEPNVRALSLEAWAQMGPHRSPSTTQAAALVLDGPSRLYLTEGPNFSQVQL